MRQILNISCRSLVPFFERYENSMHQNHPQLQVQQSGAIICFYQRFFYSVRLKFRPTIMFSSRWLLQPNPFYSSLDVDDAAVESSTDNVFLKMLEALRKIL